MPREIRTVESSWEPARAHAYMADFSNAQEWDPGVVSARRLDSGTVGPGSAFELDVKVSTGTMPMRYQITDYSPTRITFTSRSGRLISNDTVTVAERDGQTVVTYDAGLRFTGVARLANPVLSLVFRRVVDRACAGLATALNRAA